MIVLDTNVVSAIMRGNVDTVVRDWLDRCPPESIWITTITVFEVRFGIELLARGRRGFELTEGFERAIAEDFQGRILDFDPPAAEVAAAISARRRRSGRPVDMRDTFIAGIVVSRRAELATRNTRHFDDLEISIVDPWS